jgi:hypothetical protein
VALRQLVELELYVRQFRTQFVEFLADGVSDRIDDGIHESDCFGVLVHM